MYVSTTTGHMKGAIEVEKSEVDSDDITITCYPNQGASVYISITIEEAEGLVEKLEEILGERL